MPALGQGRKSKRALLAIVTAGFALSLQEGGDYEQCRNRQMAGARSACSDQAQMTKNLQLEMRIQRGFEKFKIRNSNGTDLY